MIIEYIVIDIHVIYLRTSLISGGSVYRVQMNVEHESIHFVGENCEARMVERFVRCRVNGSIEGRGVSEFQYRYVGGRKEALG